MGQIFYSSAYDIETKTCCVYDADKFHANCYLKEPQNLEIALWANYP